MVFLKRVGFLAAVALCAAAALAGTADRSAAEGARARAATKADRLVPFRSCGELLGYARSRAARFVGPWGLGGVVGRGAVPPVAPVPTAAAAREASPQEGVDFSGTNVQEEGVDEPDIVKTDGTTLFAVANGRLNAVDVGEAKPRLLDTLKLDDGWSHELLLHGDRLLVLSRGGYWAEPLPGVAARLMPYAPTQSVLAEVDVSNPKALRLVRTLTLDGAYVAARLVGRSARIVASSPIPGKLPFEQPAEHIEGGTRRRGRAQPRRRRFVRPGELAAVVPDRATGRRGDRRSAHSSSAATSAGPPAFSGLGMLTVLTVDLEKGLQPVDSVALMTDARIVYASPESLYVATERWADRPDPSAPTEEQRGVVDRRPQVRHLEPVEERSTAAAARCPDSCSANGRCPSIAACSASSAPRPPRGGAEAGRASRS